MGDPRKARTATTLPSVSEWDIPSSPARSERRRVPRSRRRRMRKVRAPKRAAVIVLLPLALAFIGGALGGATSGGAMMIGQRIAWSGAPPWIKALAMLAVTFGACASFITSLWFVRGMLQRGRGVHLFVRPANASHESTFS